MSIGQLARRALGSYEQRAADKYRAFFLDTSALADALASCVAASGEIRVLEVGCGEGLVATALLQRLPHAHLVGVDIADAPGRNYVGDPERATFRRCTVAELAADHPAPFDLVVVSDVLHHIPDGELRAVLANVVGLVAPGGLLAVKEWERDGSVGFRMGWFSDRVVSGEQVRFFDGAELRSLVAGISNDAVVVREDRIAPRRCNLLLVWRVGVPAGASGDGDVTTPAGLPA